MNKCTQCELYDDAWTEFLYKVDILHCQKVITHEVVDALADILRKLNPADSEDECIHKDIYRGGNCESD